jgi:hypothetical protein
MSKTWLVTLEVDAGWFKAIDDLTTDVYDGEVCRWISVDANTEGI